MCQQASTAQKHCTNRRLIEIIARPTISATNCWLSWCSPPKFSGPEARRQGKRSVVISGQKTSCRRIFMTLQHFALPGGKKRRCCLFGFRLFFSRVILFIPPSSDDHKKCENPLCAMTLDPPDESPATVVASLALSGKTGSRPRSGTSQRNAI
jgi:hypothetical protein